MTNRSVPCVMVVFQDTRPTDRIPCHPGLCQPIADPRASGRSIASSMTVRRDLAALHIPSLGHSLVACTTQTTRSAHGRHLGTNGRFPCNEANHVLYLMTVMALRAVPARRPNLKRACRLTCWHAARALLWSSTGSPLPCLLASLSFGRGRTPARALALH